MTQIEQVIKQMIGISEIELKTFLGQTSTKVFKRQMLLNQLNTTPHEIFFINKGLISVMIIDNDGVEHTIHFALENQFITDYASFILQQPSLHSLVALEETEVVVLPRSAIEWGYKYLEEGQKLGRLIAEFYFIYQDNRIKSMYTQTSKQRYDSITEIFPNIHNRVPQHLIASYLGITPVHLSRLKKMDTLKI